MNRKALYISLGIVLAFTLAVIAPAARADESNQASQFTFNQPVEVPGNVILPAGTYWFVLMDRAISLPDTVQIFNLDRTQVIATLDAIPILRSETTNHSELTFAEQSQKRPIALLDWFYPDRLTGHEFVYANRDETRLSTSEQITVMVQAAPLAKAS
jgi:hypothetical protein